MDNGMRLLQRAEEAGLTVTRKGEHLRIRGPRSAEAIVKELSRTHLKMNSGPGCAKGWNGSWQQTSNCGMTMTGP